MMLWNVSHMVKDWIHGRSLNVIVMHHSMLVIIRMIRMVIMVMVMMRVMMMIII